MMSSCVGSLSWFREVSALVSCFAHDTVWHDRVFRRIRIFPDMAPRYRAVSSLHQSFYRNVALSAGELS